MEILTKYNLEVAFKNNTIWEKFVKTNFNNTSFWEKEFSIFIEKLNLEFELIKNTKVSWKTTYVNFKKVVSIINYMSNYFSLYEDTHFNVTKKLKLMIIKIQEDIGIFNQKLWTDEKIINNFKEMLNLSLNLNQKKICSNWLKNYFYHQHQATIKKNYNKIDSKLQKHIETFNDNNKNNSLNRNNYIFISSTKKNSVKGLSYTTLNLANKMAKKEGLNGWKFYLNEDNVQNILMNCKNRQIRKYFYLKYLKINTLGKNTLKNGFVLKDILYEKHKIAKLFNKNNYAELVLSKFDMINTTKKAHDYLNQIDLELIEFNNSMEKEIYNLSLKDNITEIKPWDKYFYFNKLRKKQNFKNKFENYFIFEEVFPKLMNYLSKNLFLDISVETINNLYSKNSYFISIKDQKSNRKGTIIFSPYYEENKSVCYESDLLFGTNLNTNNIIPFVQYINLTIKKGKNSISKMTFFNMISLIHEFGHAMHSFFRNMDDNVCKKSLIPFELIELPSQYLEHFIYDYKFMKNLSCNIKTKLEITESEYLDIIQNELYFDAQHVFWGVQKNKAQLELYEKFKPYSEKNLQQIIENKMSNYGILYNIGEDNYMTYSDPEFDYGPAGHIYLYSAQLAFKLYLKNKINLRKMYCSIFNNKNDIKIKNHLSKYIDIKNVDTINFLKKNLKIELFK